jgi:hypothetical protein
MKKYGTAAVEDACAPAIDIAVYEYRFVRRYLERRPHPNMFLRQIDPLIRELTVYRDSSISPRLQLFTAAILVRMLEASFIYA